MRARAAALGVFTLALAVRAAATEIPISPADDETCVGSEPVPADTPEFIRAALEVLEAAGHDPAHYRLEVRHDDPFALEFAEPGPGPVLSVVFLPVDIERNYPIKVNARHPCALTWVWHPASFTPWQREVIAKAGALAEKRAGWKAGSQLDIRVIESRDLIGVEVWPIRELDRAPTASELTILLQKRDLAPAAVRVD